MTVQVGRCLLPELLASKGWTQQDLAENIPMSKNQISDYVTGRKIMSLRTSKVISLAIGCAIDDLYEWIYLEET